MLSRLLIGCIRLYQATAPFRRPVCRFHPSCSQYTLLAISKYGAFKGVWLGLKRLAKCHPFHAGGYDPLE